MWDFHTLTRLLAAFKTNSFLIKKSFLEFNIQPPRYLKSSTRFKSPYFTLIFRYVLFASHGIWTSKTNEITLKSCRRLVVDILGLFQPLLQPLALMTVSSFHRNWEKRLRESEILWWKEETVINANDCNNPWISTTKRRHLRFISFVLLFQCYFAEELILLIFSVLFVRILGL